jgi:myo-inositol 2-dehydrogenase/D-chiro-inositol 1-dehydrogenase
MGVIHDIHSARRLMGREIADAYVRWIPMDPTRDDTCRLLTVSCAFDDGALGLIDINIEASYGYAVSVEVVGTTGTVTSAHPSRRSLRAASEERHDIARDPVERFGPAYRVEIEEWARSVLDGTAAGSSAWDGYASVAVADACMASIASGRPERVELPPRPPLYERPG